MERPASGVRRSRRSLGGGSGVMVRRAAFESVHGFWAERYCEDYHMWLRLAAAGWTIANCPEDLVIYSPAPGSLSQQVERFAAAEIAPSERPLVETWKRRRLAHVAAGNSMLLVGHYDLAALTHP